MRISDWSSDVCSSDLVADREGLWSDRCSIGSRRVTFIRRLGPRPEAGDEIEHRASPARKARITGTLTIGAQRMLSAKSASRRSDPHGPRRPPPAALCAYRRPRSEEHTSELQSLMRISYAVFCLKKKNKHKTKNTRKT